MIARYGPCMGITLFRWFRWKIELWYAPADFSPPPHTHENCSGEFTILYAKNRRIWRKVGDRIDSYIANFPSVLGKFLSVRAGTPHSFDKGDSFMVWICFETWKKGVSVSSVANDFVLIG